MENLMNDQADNGLMIQDFLNLLKWRNDNQQTQHLEMHDNGTSFIKNNDGVIVRNFKNLVELVKYIRQSVRINKATRNLA